MDAEVHESIGGDPKSMSAGDRSANELDVEGAQDNMCFDPFDFEGASGTTTDASPESDENELPSAAAHHVTELLQPSNAAIVTDNSCANLLDFDVLGSAVGATDTNEASREEPGRAGNWDDFELLGGSFVAEGLSTSIQAPSLPLDPFAGAEEDGSAREVSSLSPMITPDVLSSDPESSEEEGDTTLEEHAYTAVSPHNSSDEGKHAEPSFVQLQSSDGDHEMLLDLQTDDLMSTEVQVASDPFTAVLHESDAGSVQTGPPVYREGVPNSLKLNEGSELKMKHKPLEYKDSLESSTSYPYTPPNSVVDGFQPVTGDSFELREETLVEKIELSLPAMDVQEEIDSQDVDEEHTDDDRQEEQVADIEELSSDGGDEELEPADRSVTQTAQFALLEPTREPGSAVAVDPAALTALEPEPEPGRRGPELGVTDSTGRLPMDLEINTSTADLSGFDTGQRLSPSEHTSNVNDIDLFGVFESEAIDSLPGAGEAVIRREKNAGVDSAALDMECSRDSPSPTNPRAENAVITAAEDDNSSSRAAFSADAELSGETFRLVSRGAEETRPATGLVISSRENYQELLSEELPVDTVEGSVVTLVHNENIFLGAAESTEAKAGDNLANDEEALKGNNATSEENGELKQYVDHFINQEIIPSAIAMYNAERERETAKQVNGAEDCSQELGRGQEVARSWLNVDVGATPTDLPVEGLQTNPPEERTPRTTGGHADMTGSEVLITEVDTQSQNVFADADVSPAALIAAGLDTSRSREQRSGFSDPTDSLDEAQSPASSGNDNDLKVKLDNGQLTQVEQFQDLPQRSPTGEPPAPKIELSSEEPSTAEGSFVLSNSGIEAERQAEVAAAPFDFLEMDYSGGVDPVNGRNGYFLQSSADSVESAVALQIAHQEMADAAPSEEQPSVPSGNEEIGMSKSSSSSSWAKDSESAEVFSSSVSPSTETSNEGEFLCDDEHPEATTATLCDAHADDCEKVEAETNRATPEIQAANGDLIEGDDPGELALDVSGDSADSETVHGAAGEAGRLVYTAASDVEAAHRFAEDVLRNSIHRHQASTIVRSVTEAAVEVVKGEAGGVAAGARAAHGGGATDGVGDQSAAGPSSASPEDDEAFQSSDEHDRPVAATEPSTAEQEGLQDTAACAFSSCSRVVCFVLIQK